jgi:flagellar protein FliO/FliZ
MKRIAALPLFLLPSLSARATGADLPDTTAALGQTILVLGLIIGILVLGLYLLRRTGLARPQGGQLLRLRGSVAVGPRERVVLVEVGERVLVLGVAPGRVNALDSLDVNELPSPNDAHRPGSEDFQRWLKRTLERRQP